MDGGENVDPRLKEFVTAADALVRATPEAGDCAAAAPLMRSLVAAGECLLAPAQMRDDPNAYAHNAFHLAEADGVSLYALVWRPGQTTPVHDHGTWGVVGVLEGVLEERAFIAEGGAITADHGIRLRRGGMVLLAPGSVSTFVPNPGPHPCNRCRRGRRAGRQPPPLRSRYQLLSHLRRRRRNAAPDRRPAFREPLNRCAAGSPIPAHRCG